MNPLYPANVNSDIDVLLDSGAFQDVSQDSRLSFEGALERQLNYEEKQRFISERIVSYDRLVDEQLNSEGKQIKERVDWEKGEKYVEETINAAKFLADNRNELEPRKLVLSNQGTNIQQYLDCIKEILSFSEPHDIIGFGGFCIVGQKPKLVPQYYKIISRAIPLIRKKGIKEVHLFGVGTIPILETTAQIAKRCGVNLNYDTSTYEFNGVMGRTFVKGFTSLKQTYSKEDKFVNYNPNQQAHENIRAVVEYWKDLKQQTLWNFTEEGLST